jgi:hypothetical protein
MRTPDRLAAISGLARIHGSPGSVDVFLQAPAFVRPDPQAPGWAEAEELQSAALAALWDGSKTARQLTREVVPPIDRLLKARAG